MGYTCVIINPYLLSIYKVNNKSNSFNHPFFLILTSLRHCLNCSIPMLSAMLIEREFQDLEIILSTIVFSIRSAKTLLVTYIPSYNNRERIKKSNFHPKYTLSTKSQKHPYHSFNNLKSLYQPLNLNNCIKFTNQYSYSFVTSTINHHIHNPQTNPHIIPIKISLIIIESNSRIYF